jgi:hypothetical protein
MRFGSSWGERAAGVAGVLAALVILVVCLDLACDGQLLGWLGVPASSTTEVPDDGGV